MSDCPNVEMREALPELLHGRLAAAQVAKVREHLAACAECVAELELLERVRRAYATAPAIDTAAIVRALPAPARTHAAPGQARKPSLGVLRLAAAVVLVITGALVLRTVMGGADKVVDTTELIVSQPDSAPVTTPDTPAVSTPRTQSQPRVLAMTVSEVDDLEIDELETLLGALDRIDAAPVAEPDTLIGSVRGVGSGNGN
jgi:predicted anti-sigma-YlaC factor YlaD